MRISDRCIFLMNLICDRHLHRGGLIILTSDTVDQIGPFHISLAPHYKHRPITCAMTAGGQYKSASALVNMN